MNKLIPLVCLLLAACSSEPVKQATPAPAKKATAREAVDSSGKLSTEKKTTSTQLIEIKPDLTATQVIQKPEADLNADLYIKLDRAIKTQNQNLVKQYSLEILQNDSKDVKGLNALAMHYYSKSMYRTAEQLLNTAMVGRQDVAAVYNNLGLIYQAQNDPRRAMDYFQKSIESNLDNSAASENLGSLYVQAKQYAKAIEVLKPFASNSKTQEASQINFAVALTGVNQISEAVALYEKILSKNSNQKIALANLAAIKIEKLSLFNEGLDLLNRLKFVDTDLAAQNTIKTLENKAKAGLK